MPAASIRGFLVVALVVVTPLRTTDAAAQPPPDPAVFQAGVFADSARTLDCVGGPPGTSFRQYVWAWAPDVAANYLTIRFRFPGNVDVAARPMLNALVTDLIITDYGTGGVEWNFILTGCPTGWILLYRQDCTILTDDASEIVVSGEHSLARDCAFVLVGMSALNNLQVNAGACSPTPVAPSTWGTIKAMYRW